MAAIQGRDIENEKRFINLFWDYIKDFYIPEDSDDYWQALIARADDIYNECPTEMARTLLCAYADYLDKKWHKERNEMRNEMKKNGNG